MKKISIKKHDQFYLLDIIKKYPGINSGRKNYTFQYKRVLKCILLSQTYELLSKNKNIYFFRNYSFDENGKFYSIKLSQKRPI